MVEEQMVSEFPRKLIMVKAKHLYDEDVKKVNKTCLRRPKAGFKSLCSGMDFH